MLRVKSEKNVFSALVLFVSRPYHVNYAGFTYSILNTVGNDLEPVQLNDIRKYFCEITLFKTDLTLL